MQPKSSRSNLPSSTWVEGEHVRALKRLLEGVQNAREVEATQEEPN